MQYVGERSRDGVKKGLIWMGHNKLIRLGTPQYLKINEKLSKVLFMCSREKKSEISK